MSSVGLQILFNYRNKILMLLLQQFHLPERKKCFTLGVYSYSFLSCSLLISFENDPDDSSQK